MVIQANMPVSGVTKIWPETKIIFESYNISIDNNKSLKEILPEKELEQLLFSLNDIIGSSKTTCTNGG